MIAVAFGAGVRNNGGMSTTREIYLLRHAEAADVGACGATCDADRMLTEKGIRQAHAAGRFLEEIGVKPARVFASPLARAQATAQIVMGELGLAGPLISADELSPDGAPESIWRLIRTPADSGPLLLVGHLPSIAIFAGWLLEGASLHFRKASLARIDVTPPAHRPQATLEWLLPVSVAKACIRMRPAPDA